MKIDIKNKINFFENNKKNKEFVIFIVNKLFEDDKYSLIDLCKVRKVCKTWKEFLSKDDKSLKNIGVNDKNVAFCDINKYTVDFVLSHIF